MFTKVVQFQEVNTEILPNKYIVSSRLGITSQIIKQSISSILFYVKFI